MVKRFEVLIVGAGPSGSMAADILARSGANVCLFDGRPEGDPKPCGGGVTTKAFNYYPHLLHALSRTISEVYLYSSSGREIRIPLKDSFAIFSRTEFDSYLCHRAAEGGATVVKKRVRLESGREFPNEDWILKSPDGESWSGQTIVAADGVNSAIARSLAGTLGTQEMEVAFGYRSALPTDGEVPTAVAFLPNWVGYAWAFPRLDHLSFGIATTQKSFDFQKLDEMLWSFIHHYHASQSDPSNHTWRDWHTTPTESEKSDLTKMRRSQDFQRYAARIPGVSAETWETRKVVGSNWALLGDAAGFADSITGEGIFYALRSAELFADAYLEGNVMSYEERWRADFGAELIRAAKMRERFYGTFAGGAFTERMIQFAQRHGGIKRTLGELVAGDQGYVNLKRKLLRRSIAL